MFISWSIVIVINLILRSSFGEENILIKKVVKTSENSDKSHQLNDGDNKQSCFEFQSQSLKWAVFDLEKIYKIEKLNIWNGKNTGRLPISIYIGSEFSPCKFHQQVKNYQLCKSGVIQNNEKIEIVCQGSGVTGQYVAIVKGSFSNDDNFESFVLCEVEAFGKYVTNSGIRSRPKISSEPLPKITAKDFPIIQEIRKDVPSVTIPEYSTSISFVNADCQPIIWDKNILSTFGIACVSKNGKVRMTSFGKNEFLKELFEKKNNEKFASNLKKWLSPQTTNPMIINSKEIKVIEFLKSSVNEGSIIDFDVWNPMKDDVRKELKSMWLKGSIAINVDHTFWVETSIEARNSYMDILNVFNVDFSSNYINWDRPSVLTMRENEINENLIGIELQLSRMVVNHDYLIEKADTITKVIEAIPHHLTIRSQIKQILFLLMKKYDELLNWICPCKVNPAINKTDRNIIQLLGQLFMNQALVNSNYKMPGIDLFPGDFTTVPKKETVTFIIDSRTSETWNPIGYYLEPGSTLNYKINKIQGTWTMAVGCHTDTLTDERPEWYRYPNINVRDVPILNEGSVFSPYGGVIWLINKKANETIDVTITNIVASPFFNLMDENSIRNWNSQRNNPGLWAQIVGDNIVFCVESKDVRSFSGDYLRNLMKNNWDILVKLDFSIKSKKWEDEKPEIVVLDIMPSVGYGHSGYPIVAFYEWFNGIFNISLIQKEGNWGMCHEIGHNMQEDKWTFDGTGEVTNNLFCLFNYKTLWNLPYYGSNELKLFRDYDRTEEVKKFLNSGANFETWKSEPFHALLIYAQMANNFGFGFYKSVFKYYIDNQLDPTTDADKMSTWMNVTSTVVGRNLLPMFYFWGFPIDRQIENYLKHLPCYFPNDFYKDLSPIRNKLVAQKYKSCTGEIKYFAEFSDKNLWNEMRRNFIKAIIK